MNRLRLLMITPRYWPLAGDTERVTEMLADQFAQRGVTTTVLTASWDGGWPTTICQRLTRVERLPTAPRGGWSTFRYLRSLATWLRAHRTDFDLVYVMNLRDEAYAAVGALRGRGVPVVLRAERAGASGDCRWQSHARFGRRVRQRCQQAAAVLASTQGAVAELVAAGYSAARYIPPGAAARPVCTAADRYHARAALAEINHDLAVAEYAPVALCVDRLAEDRGLAALLRAWRPVGLRWPSAKLWIVGDGALREALYNLAVDLQLHHQVYLPGSFDDLSELYQAADVFVSAAPDFGATQALLDALAAGLPVVAADTPDLREIVADNVAGHLLPPDQPQRWTATLSELFESPAQLAQLGQAARTQISAVAPLERTVDEHLKLFKQLASPHGGSTS